MARASAVRAIGQAMHQQGLDDLREDRARRIERRGRALRDIGDAPTAHFGKFGPVHPVHAHVADAHAICGDVGAEARIAHQGQRDGGLARTGLTDQRQHFAPRDGEGNVLDNDSAAAIRGVQDDIEAADLYRNVLDPARSCLSSRLERIDQQVGANRQGRNGDRRHNDRQGALGQPRDILSHQRAQVGKRRLHTEAQEAQPRQQQHDEHETQAHVGQKRMDHVGQNFTPGDINRAFAPRAGHLHEIERGQVHRQRARDAEIARHIDDRCDHQQQSDRRAERRDQHEREDLRRDGGQRIHDAGEDLVDPTAADRSDKSQRGADRNSEHGRAKRQEHRVAGTPQSTGSAHRGQDSRCRAITRATFPRIRCDRQRHQPNRER